MVGLGIIVHGGVAQQVGRHLHGPDDLLNEGDLVVGQA